MVSVFGALLLVLVAACGSDTTKDIRPGSGGSGGAAEPAGSGGSTVTGSSTGSGGAGGEQAGCTDGETETCYSADPSTQDVGACAGGTKACEAGHFGACEGEVTPTDEVCNGIDDDCDGQIDQGFGEETCGVGACQVTVPKCEGGELVVCEPKAPPSTVDLCDGLDDNCDGTVNGDCACEGAETTSCYSGSPATQNVGACKDGSQTCAGGEWGPCTGDVLPASETCNGVDDDCNGAVDDGLPDIACGVGECAVTVPGCSQGVVPACIPLAAQIEVCDGLDNDCNGAVDDGNPGGGAVCSTGALGVCAAGTTLCQAGAVACVQNVMASAEVCDGLDNDCNGAVDDGNPGGGAVCSTGAPGVCSSGTLVCQAGSVGCVASVMASSEVCDGLDNDCNGAVDDGNPGGGAACSTGALGVCAAGTTACQAGAGACVQNVMASAEVCSDSADNDCDGVVDNGCCTNIALQATPSISSGGNAGFYTPSELNNGTTEADCIGFSWINSSTVASGGYFQYDWATPQTIYSFYVDGVLPGFTACGYSPGRNVMMAVVQYWNGAAWVNAGTIAQQENYFFTFASPIVTTKLRLYDVRNGPGVGNAMIYEWYVYTEAGCPVPS